MAQVIQGSVGQGGRNLAPDVTLVQTLLNAVVVALGGPIVKLVIDGLVGPKTTGAITTFQTKHFGVSGADGRIDPGKQTFAKLVAVTAGQIADANFQGFQATQVQTLKADIARAQSMIGNAMSLLALAPFLRADAPGKVNVVKLLAFNFGIDFADKDNPINFALQSALLAQLQGRFALLRSSLTATLPFVAAPAPQSGFGADAFVIGVNDPTINITPQYFTKPADERSAILTHEHAHTKFKVAGHPGMGGGLAILVVGPEDDKRPFFQPAGRFLDQSLNNPYCYEWLVRALDNGASAKVFSASCLCATAA